MSEWIGERFVTPDVDVPRYQAIDEETAAAAVRAEWELGEKPIKHMVRLLEQHGIHVFSLAEDCAEMDAYSVWHNGTPYVFLNTKKSAERSRMDAAHELGHLVLHSKGGPKGRQAELEAERFASAFLMPSGSVYAHAPSGTNLSRLIQAKHYWNVSLAALVYRMHTLDLLNDSQYRSAFTRIAQLGYRKNEPQTGKREASVVLAKVFTTLRDEGLTTARIADELAIPEVELHNMVFGFAFVSMPGGGRPESLKSAQGSESILRFV